MHTSNQDSHNTTLTSLMLSIVFALVFVFATVTGAYAADNTSATVLDAFAGSGSGALVMPLANPGSSSGVFARNHLGSFGSFSGESPQALTVDQSSGDVYVVDTVGGSLLRFSSTGAPVAFTAGPAPGTNTITGLSFQQFASFDQIAVDSSGGPSNGNIYVTQSGSGQVKVFASTGEPLGTLTGSGTPAGGLGEDCGVAVDQADGDVYVASYSNRVWRYSPSGGTVTEADYSGGIATSINPCQLAVSNGSLYAKDWKESPFVGAGGLDEYATSTFALGAPPSPPATQISSKATAVSADASSGDVYVDEGNQISVFDPSGAALYSFGSGDFSSSTGVAVTGGGNAYVSNTTTNQIETYGPTLELGSRALLGGFGSFSGESPQALTVDQTTGDVYALDTAGGRLLRFSSTGHPVSFPAGPAPGTNTITGLSLQQFASFDQVAVDSSGGPSNGNIYVTQSGSGQVKVFASTGEPLGTLTGSGTPAGGLGEDCGVAVDQADGDVYVASYSNRVWRYTPSGATVTEADYSGGIATSINPCQLAVSQGSLYAKDWKETPFVGAGGLEKYATSAFALGAPPSAPATQIASKATAVSADPSNGDVYVDETNRISVFASTGAALYSFGSGDFTASTGVAVMTGGNAYVSNTTTHQVEMYGPFSAPPALVETFAATEVKHVKATLNGHLDSNNGLPITSCVFEWGTDTSYTETPLACTQGNSFTGPATVSTELAGLTPGTTYHFRLHLTTAARGFDGQDQNFETIAASTAPEVSTGAGTIVSATSTQVKGTIDPNANPLTGCNFEYVTETAFQTTGFTDLSTGASIPCDQTPGSITPDFEDHEVTATITGLDPKEFYRYRLKAENTNAPANGTDILLPGPPIAETTGSPTRTTTTARLDSRITPHGAPTTYHFQYTTNTDYQTNGYSNATNTTNTPLTNNETQQVEVNAREGQFRLAFAGQTTGDIAVKASPAQAQAALRALPNIGTQNITVTGRQEAGGATIYYIVTFTGGLANSDVPQLVFSDGTVPLKGGGLGSFVSTTMNGGLRESSYFVSAALQDLKPATIYHYRVVADNGTPGEPTYGSDRTITTRTSNASLTHGNFPGPPGSDRAWEQVNVPDTGGNGVGVLSISDNGERAIDRIDGGSPGSTYGGETFGDSNDQFAERTPDGWQRRDLFPTRAQAQGNIWGGPWGSTDLSELYALNRDETHSGTDDLFRIAPGTPAQHLYGAPPAAFELGSDSFFTASDDGSKMIGVLKGTNDPAYPLEPNQQELYDLTSGSPKLIGLLPGNSLPTCGVFSTYMKQGGGDVPPVQHWLTPDGSHVFFNTYPGSTCIGLPSLTSLYDRDLVHSTTTLIADEGIFIRSAAGAVFFITPESLVADDTEGLDIYRYQISDGNLRCLTCAVPGGADVQYDRELIAVSDDGSRIYLSSSRHLLAGAASPGIYRLDVASGDLAYVAPAFDTKVSVGPNQGKALNPDGSVFVFWSASPELNALNGQQNGGTTQYYRYDDRDRSLVCTSCPSDGSVPREAVNRTIDGNNPGANSSPVTNDGDFFFVTPTPLVPADQNTAPSGQDPLNGDDLYEWRDGRLLLVTDGKTEAKNGQGPGFIGLSGDGRNVFFVQSAALTPDAIDSVQRLYDARVGGGFEFPHERVPCSLEVCQGIASPPPNDGTPASLSFSGPGNEINKPVSPRQCVGGKCVKSHPPKRCVKGKVLKHGKCVKKLERKRSKRTIRNHGGAK
jgi:hypothetical protein